MIRTFDEASGTFVPLSGPLSGKWIDVVGPTPAEIERLERELGIVREFIVHACDVHELARVARKGETMLVMIEEPRSHGRGDAVPFRAAPLGVVVRPGQVVTIAGHESEVVEAIAPHARELVDRPVSLMLEMIFAAADRFLHHLREIDRRVVKLEEQLRTSQQNREVLQLLRYQKALTFFMTALDHDEAMLVRLQRDPAFGIAESDGPRIEDVLVEIHQAKEMAEVAGNILSQMMDAFASIISNNLNRVMKVLTALTLIIMVPNLLYSAYGMNVELPIQRHPASFVIITTLSILLSVAVLVLFRHKRWL